MSARPIWLKAIVPCSAKKFPEKSCVTVLNLNSLQFIFFQCIVFRRPWHSLKFGRLICRRIHGEFEKNLHSFLSWKNWPCFPDFSYIVSLLHLRWKLDDSAGAVLILQLDEVFLVPTRPFVYQLMPGPVLIFKLDEVFLVPTLPFVQQ